MNYFYFVLILAALCSGFIVRRRNLTISLILILIVFLIMRYPEISVAAAKDGMNLWIFVVMPSLLPFFIINDMLISLRVPENIAKLFAPVAKVLFKTSGYGAYVFIMSVFSGYPAGAKITSELIGAKKITPREGQKILSFSSTSGPLFIVGVVGSGMLGSASAGYLLIISHILGSVVNGIVFGIIMGKRTKNTMGVENKAASEASVGEMLTKSILNSLITGGLIGGYVVLFSVIIALFNKIEFFNIFSSFIHYILFIPREIADIFGNILKASLEISNGCNILSSSPLKMDLKPVLISFIIAFSGLSIIGQVASILNKSKINLGLYIITKLTHGLFSSLICYLLLKAGAFNIPVSAGMSSFDLSISNEYALILLLLIGIMLLNLLSMIRKNSYR